MVVAYFFNSLIFVMLSSLALLWTNLASERIDDDGSHPIYEMELMPWSAGKFVVRGASSREGVVLDV